MKKMKALKLKVKDEIQSSYLTKAAFQTLPFALALLSWNLELPNDCYLIVSTLKA